MYCCAHCYGLQRQLWKKSTYVFIHDEDGEIVDSFVDKSDRYDDEDDFSGGIRMDDGSIMTDDDDYLDEFGEDML